VQVLVSSQFDGARGLESLKKSGENVTVMKHGFEQAAEALKSPCGQPGPGAGFGEIRSDSQFPTKFSRRFPPTSHLLERVGGFRDRIGQVRRSDDLHHEGESISVIAGPRNQNIQGLAIRSLTLRVFCSHRLPLGRTDFLSVRGGPTAHVGLCVLRTRPRTLDGCPRLAHYRSRAEPSFVPAVKGVSWMGRG